MIAQSPPAVIGEMLDSGLTKKDRFHRDLVLHFGYGAYNICCRRAFRLSPKTRDDPASSVHVRAILVSKVFQHHLFLTRNPIQVQRDKSR